MLPLTVMTPAVRAPLTETVDTPPTAEKVAAFPFVQTIRVPVPVKVQFVSAALVLQLPLMCWYPALVAPSQYSVTPSRHCREKKQQTRQSHHSLIHVLLQASHSFHRASPSAVNEIQSLACLCPQAHREPISIKIHHLFTENKPIILNKRMESLSLYRKCGPPLAITKMEVSQYDRLSADIHLECAHRLSGHPIRIHRHASPIRHVAESTPDYR